LDGLLRETLTDLAAARREMHRQLRRFESANTALDRRRLHLTEKVRLRETQLTEKARRLSILYEVGQAMVTTLDLDHLLALIVRLAARHLQARKASLMLVEGESGTLRINAAVGIRRWIVEKTRIRLGEPIAGLVATQGEPILIRDIARDGLIGRPCRSTYHTGSFLSVPLKRHQRVLGVLNVSDKRSREPFSTEDFHLVNTLASQAAVAVENAVLLSSLREKVVSLEALSATLEKERRQLSTLINNMTDGVLAVSTRNDILFINGRAASLLGRGFDPGTPLAALATTGDLGAAVQESLTQALEGEGNRREVTLEPDPERRECLELVTVPVREEGGREMGALSLVRDITEIKEMDQARTDFLSTVSHQIKTPAGIIAGFADTLQHYADLPAEKQQHFLRLIQVESTRLTTLLDNLMNFNRVESGILRVEMRQSSLAEVLADTLAMTAARATERGVRFVARSMEGLPPVETDPTLLQEVVRNVLDNSLKFTPPGGTIGIAGGREGDAVHLRVRDTGTGIDEQDLPRLFEKFFTVSRRNQSGTGLGLYIARRILHSLRGDIALASRPGEGTVVTITLPVAPE
jgi:two-component system phosphate regulon sensor histidine kinase PhoR